MLKQQVAFVPVPATLLSRERAERPVLFDGNAGHAWGDGSVVFAANPVETLALSAGLDDGADPLELLQDFADQHLGNGCAGVAVALSYDLKHWIERLPRRLAWPNAPVLYAAAFDWAYVADTTSREAAIVGASERALSKGAEVLARTSLAGPDPGDGGSVQLPSLEPTLAKAHYVAMVERTKEYIAAGDIYQANMSQSFRCPMRISDAPDLFREWTSRFPTPYAAYVDGGEWVLLSNSPECFLDVRGDRIATFPIKGTRASTDGADLGAISRDLTGDPKERAEHIMIVDLERNDLGRVCVPGSVFVPEMQVSRHFPMLVHMVSRVSGTLRDGVGIADILRATFPGGSITGAPKVRAMEIIEELEPEPRGFYTGSIGWLEPGGRARFNIAIRTAQVDAGGLSFHAGGGIVADSDPNREYEETFAKSQSLFRTLSGREDNAMLR